MCFTFISVPFGHASERAFVLDEASVPTSLAPFADYFVDPSRQLIFEDINGNSERTIDWQSVPAKGISEGFTNAVIWVRFSVQNAAYYSLAWNLEIGYPMLDHVSLYIPSDTSAYRLIEAGDTLPFSTRPIAYRNIVFPFHERAGETNTYYLRVQSQSAMVVPLMIWPKQSFYRQVAASKFTFGWIVGILALAVISTFASSFLFRDRTFLWLSMTFFTHTLVLTGLKGVNTQYLWPESTWWSSASVPFLVSLCFFPSLISCGKFNKLNQLAPRIAKATTILAYICLVSTLLSLVLSYRFSMIFATILCVTVPIVCIGTGFLSWKKGDVSSFFFMGSWVVYLVSSVTFSLSSVGILPARAFDQWYQEFGYIFFVGLLFSGPFLRLRKQQISDAHSHTAYLEAVTKAEKRYRSLFENAIEGLFLLNQSGKLLKVNITFCRLLNESKDSLLEKADADFSLGFLSKQDAQEIKEALLSRKPVTNMTASIRRESLSSNANIKWLSVSIKPTELTIADEAAFEGSITDISDSKERELAEKQIRMAEAATEAKSMFLANMSHEIRTPMNAIVGFTNIALQKCKDQRLEEYLTKIKYASANLLSIINDILDFSKIEAGKLEIEAKPFSLDELLDGLHSILDTSAKEKGLRFGINIDPDLPISLIGDPLRLHQVLLNLGSNAVKFTEQGSVTFEINLLYLDKISKVVDFEVKVIDTGIGISKEQQSKLFQAFSQADASTTRLFGGTGLGLSISKQLVELMGGRISIQSQIEMGTCFRVQLSCQLNKQPVEKNKENLSSQTYSSSESFNGLKALVVEDVSVNRDLIKEILIHQGIDVTLAENGLIGVNESRQTQYDLILMDMQMPVMDGIEAAKAISKEQPNTPIIALTANAMAEDAIRCANAGMKELVTKPIDEQLLFKKIAKVLGVSSYSATDHVEKRVSKTISPSNINHDMPRERLPLNIEDGLKRCKQNSSLYQSLLKDFKLHYQHASQDILQYYNDHAFDELSDLAHTIKGVAANLGAEKVADACSQLENINSVDAEEKFLFLDTFNHVLADFITNLDRYLIQAEEEPISTIKSEPNPGVEKDVNELWNELKESIEEQKVDAIDTANRLLSGLSMSDPKHLALQSIIQSLDNFDFQKANSLFEEHDSQDQAE